MGFSIKSFMHWFEELLEPERRSGERWASPRLAVYFWNGWTPIEHGVRDISTSGVYLITEAEWSPGAKLLLTLQRKELAEGSLDRWIAVEAKVVRRGSDGLALSFVPSGCRSSSGMRSDLHNGVNRKELNRFLSSLFKSDNFQLQPSAASPTFST
jgi:hypothetical protein